MSKPATKRANAAPKRRQTIPAKQRSRAPVVDEDDEDDVDEDDDLPSADQALTLFFRKPPTQADHVVVYAITPSGDQVVQDRTASEARQAPRELADSTVSACERYARTEGRELRFRAAWMASDRTLATYQWRCGEGDPTQRLDGTVESLLAQNQRHMETRERMSLEAFGSVQEAWGKVLRVLTLQNEALRVENETLRDRLRKAGDVDAEIAIQHTAAELEARTRTADLLEHRLMPIVQAIVMKQIAGATLQPSAAATDVQEKGANSDGSADIDRPS